MSRRTNASNTRKLAATLDSTEQDILATPEPTPARTRGARAVAATMLDEEDEDVVAATPPPRSARATRMVDDDEEVDETPAVRPRTQEQELEEEEEETPAQKPSGRVTRPLSRVPVKVQEEDDDLVYHSTRKAQRSTAAATRIGADVAAKATRARTRILPGGVSSNSKSTGTKVESFLEKNNYSANYIKSACEQEDLPDIRDRVTKILDTVSKAFEKAATKKEKATKSEEELEPEQLPPAPKARARTAVRA